MAESVEEIRNRVRTSYEGYHDLVASVEQMLQDGKKAAASRAPNADEHVVVLASGGLDSSVMMHWVIDKYKCRIHPLFFRRGARAEKLEEKAFDFFVDYYKSKFPDNMGEAAKLDYEVPPIQFKKDFPPELSATIGHPMRNSTMQNLAVMYAVALNGKHDLKIRTILSGSTGDDLGEPEQGLLSLRAQTFSTCVQMGGWGWNITSPFIDSGFLAEPVYKKHLIEYAMQNFIPLDKTRTCFGSDELACGECFACMKRLKAFESLGYQDPAGYKK
jgi:7-cyano-7-deazaguanine synthase in queuosine biosynthesis